MNLETPSLNSIDRLCMEHINKAIENMNNNTSTKDEENLSIIERIMIKTGNPKIAAVLALDLFLVGVDTVSNWACMDNHFQLPRWCERVCAVCTAGRTSNRCTDKLFLLPQFHIYEFIFQIGKCVY